MSRESDNEVDSAGQRQAGANRDKDRLAGLMAGQHSRPHHLATLGGQLKVVTLHTESHDLSYVRFEEKIIIAERFKTFFCLISL